jgi:hypothetical protein
MDRSAYAPNPELMQMIRTLAVEDALLAAGWTAGDAYVSPSGEVEYLSDSHESRTYDGFDEILAPLPRPVSEAVETLLDLERTLSDTQ